MTEAGYYYPPQPAETERDRYENDFDNWLNDRWDPETKTVYGLEWDDAWEDPEVWDTFMDEQNRAREI